MSLVGIAMTVPTIVFLLVGGVASDRFDRRRLMVAADLGRAVAGGLLGGPGADRRARALAHRSCSSPSTERRRRSSRRRSTRSSPSCCPSERLAQANALDQLVRPLVLRMAGPALGGVLIAVAGRGRGVPARRRVVPDLRAARC